MAKKIEQVASEQAAPVIPTKTDEQKLEAYMVQMAEILKGIKTLQIKSQHVSTRRLRAFADSVASQMRMKLNVKVWL